MSTISHRVALLIDAENANPKQFKTVVEHVALLGRAMIKRAYGNPTALKKWEKVLSEHHVVPVQTPPSARKPNASDFALTIDAVGLLHDGRYDHLCIVSSDADFTLLAIHVREHGKHITGFGEKKTPATFRSVGDGFVELAGAGVAKSGPPPTATTPPASKIAPAAKKRAPAASRSVKPAVDQGKLRSVYEEAAEHSTDGVTLQHIGQLLSQRNVDYRGYRTLTNYLRESGLFSVKDNRVTLA